MPKRGAARPPLHPRGCSGALGGRNLFSCRSCVPPALIGGQHRPSRRRPSPGHAPSSPGEPRTGLSHTSACPLTEAPLCTPWHSRRLSRGRRDLHPGRTDTERPVLGFDTDHVFPFETGLKDEHRRHICPARTRNATFANTLTQDTVSELESDDARSGTHVGKVRFPGWRLPRTASLFPLICRRQMGPRPQDFWDAGTGPQNVKQPPPPHCTTWRQRPQGLSPSLLSTAERPRMRLRRLGPLPPPRGPHRPVPSAELAAPLTSPGAHGARPTFPWLPGHFRVGHQASRAPTQTHELHPRLQKRRKSAVGRRRSHGGGGHQGMRTRIGLPKARLPQGVRAAASGNLCQPHPPPHPPPRPRAAAPRNFSQAAKGPSPSRQSEGAKPGAGVHGPDDSVAEAGVQGCTERGC